MSLKVDVEKKESCRRELKIEVPAEAVSTKFEEAYKQIAKVASLPGFRAGRVPQDLVKKHYSQDARKLVIEDLLPEYYIKALEKVKFNPVQDPRFSDIELEEGQGLCFKASLDIRPKFKLGTYTGLKIKPDKAEVKKEEIDRVLENVQQQVTTYKEVKDRPARKGDTFTCNFVFLIDGKAVRRQRKATFPLEDSVFGSEFTANIEGLSIGRKKEFDVTLPESFQPKEQAGKKAHFKIELKEIREKQVPEINDELAQKVSPGKTLKEIRQNIEKDMLVNKEREVNNDLERQIVEALIKNNEFDVPQSMIDGETENLIRNAKMRLMYQGFSKEQVELQEDKLREQMRSNAETNVKSMFIMSEIINKEGIKVSDDDLDLRIKTMAQESRQKEEDVRKYLGKKNMMENLRWEETNKKAMDFLIEKSNKS